MPRRAMHGPVFDARYDRGAMDRRRQIARWFAGGGVPQMVEGYSTEQRMDARGRALHCRLETSREWGGIADQLPGTPAESLAAIARTAVEPPRRLTWQERMNLVFLMLVSQLVQSLFVGVLVLLVLVALGLLAIPASVQETWVGERVQTVIGFELLGEPRLLSGELVVTAGLLGGVCALYFTGLAPTDAAFRAEFHARVVGDVEQIMAVKP